MGKPILKELRERLIKTFFDILILSMMHKDEMSGYDIISAVQAKLGFLASSGTVYSKLYSLERDGLIKGKRQEKKRTYQLTPYGQKTLKTILTSEDPIKSVLAVLGINQDGSTKA